MLQSRHVSIERIRHRRPRPVIGQEKSSPGQSQRVYDLPILRKNWVVQSAGKEGRGTPTLTISGGTGYYEQNWGRVDGVVSAIEQMMRDDEDVALSERLYAPSSGSASTRVIGKYKIRAWSPEWQHSPNGSRVALDWSLNLLELPEE